MEPKEYIESLVANARIAQAKLETYTQEQIDVLVREIALTVFENADPFAKLAAEESRMGVYEDKIKKNQGKARIIWNSLKGKKSVGVLERGEDGVTTVARPVGVVGASTPCTNPVVTPMCNAMFAVKGRNTIIICPHPRTKKTNKVVCDEIIRRITALGAPENTIQYIEEPSVELSAMLMKSVDVVVATGGMGMVKSAYSSGKPALGVGAGNVQCIIDRDTDYREACPKIVAGRKFDNGIICSGEQTLIVPAEEYDAIIAEMVKNGCYFVSAKEDVDKLRAALFPDGVMNKNLVGQGTKKIAEAAGLTIPEDTKVILVEAPACGKDDYLSKEKMCPVISTYRYNTLEEACDIAQANLNVEGRGHSVSFHTNSKEHAEYLASRLTVCRVLINQICSTCNGGAFSNALTPTTTLGCGSWGNNSISENLSYKHLLNIIRIGYNNGKTQPSDEEIWG